MSEEPLAHVAVITPVFNGAAHIEGCVRSVQAQEHADWVHLVVDNASTDETPAIVARLAQADPRVRLVRFEEHLPMLGSWNRATAQAPADAVYVKHLGADDRMTPDCLRLMVAAAEEEPGVAMVAARWREGHVVAPPRPVPHPYRMSGREAMRRWLLGGPDTFGNPSACLFLRAALDGVDELYPLETWPPGHPDGGPGPAADKVGCARVLERGGFVFLPQVLTHDSDNVGSQTGISERMRVQVPGDLDALLTLGPRLVDPAELRRRARALSARYSRSLMKAALQGRPWREPRFTAMHHHVLQHLDARMAGGRFSASRALLAPHRVLYRRLHERSARSPAGR